MKKLSLFLPLLLLLTGSVLSQDANVEPTPAPQAVQQDARGNMLREIGLSPDQVRAIRKLNMNRKPLMEAAQQRLRNANRLLDEAIYADEVIDADVQARLKEAQVAQAEVFKIRSTSELAIRRVLTPDQLMRFRELRRRFEEQARQNAEMKRTQNRMDRDAAGIEQFRKGQRRLRPGIRTGQPQKQP